MIKINKQTLFQKIVSLIKKRGAKKIAVFGSYARGEEKPKSDIDILAEIENVELRYTISNINMGGK